MKNDLKLEFKKTWLEFRDWVNYVRDYKEHLQNEQSKDNEIITLNNTIEKKNLEIDQMKVMDKAKTDILQKKDEIISEQKTKISNLEVRNQKNEKEKTNLIEELTTLTNKLKITESKRRVNAVEIGHRQRKINKLEQELERANQKIIWLKNNQKAPSKEEILAYETRMKEVEKRLKEQK